MLLELLLCQKYNREAAGVSVYSTAKQIHIALIKKSVNNQPFPMMPWASFHTTEMLKMTVSCFGDCFTIKATSFAASWMLLMWSMSMSLLCLHHLTSIPCAASLSFPSKSLQFSPSSPESFLSSPPVPLPPLWYAFSSRSSSISAVLLPAPPLSVN